MTKINIDIPRLNLKPGVLRQPKAFRLTIETERTEIPTWATVISWPKLVWKVARAEYSMRWWQWPYVILVIARVALMSKQGLPIWPMFTSKNT